MLDFSHTLYAAGFILSRYISPADISVTNTSEFKPDAALPMNRYGTRTAKGFPIDQLQHGQSTFWLSDLFRAPSFLAAHPMFAGIVVPEPPPDSVYNDLCYAASPILGGAYGYLKNEADALGLLGDKSGVLTGPKSSPGAPGVAAGMPGAQPDPISSTVPAPAPAPVADPAVWTDLDTAALIGLIERHLPGQGAQLAALVRTAGKIRAAGGGSAAFISALPEIEAELGVSDPRIAAALGLIALFAR